MEDLTWYPWSVDTERVTMLFEEAASKGIDTSDMDEEDVRLALEQYRLETEA